MMEGRLNAILYLTHRAAVKKLFGRFSDLKETPVREDISSRKFLKKKVCHVNL